MVKTISLIVLVLGFSIAAKSQNANKPMRQLIDENLSYAAQQYKVLLKSVPPTVMPRSYDSSKGGLITSNTKWWTSGFYPGTLWMIYDHTKDPAIREEAEKRLAILEKEKHYTGNHDLGFMMFCSFGTAYDITKNP